MNGFGVINVIIKTILTGNTHRELQGTEREPQISVVLFNVIIMVACFQR